MLDGLLYGCGDAVIDAARRLEATGVRLKDGTDSTGEIGAPK